MTEQWKAVPGFEGLYEVSDLGRVRRVGGRVLKPALAGKGYLHLALSVNGKRHDALVHRLVAAAFLGPPKPGEEVRHDDGVKTNCRLDNLRYGTAQQNSDDKWRHGTMPFGDTHHNAVLTAAAVREIRAQSGVSYSALGRRYGVSPATVRDAMLRRTWTHV